MILVFAVLSFSSFSIIFGSSLPKDSSSASTWTSGNKREGSSSKGDFLSRGSGNKDQGGSSSASTWTTTNPSRIQRGGDFLNRDRDSQGRSSTSTSSDSPRSKLDVDTALQGLQKNIEKKQSESKNKTSKSTEESAIPQAPVLPEMKSSAQTKPSKALTAEDLQQEIQKRKDKKAESDKSKSKAESEDAYAKKVLGAMAESDAMKKTSQEAPKMSTKIVAESAKKEASERQLQAQTNLFMQETALKNASSPEERKKIQDNIKQLKQDVSYETKQIKQADKALSKIESGADSKKGMSTTSKAALGIGALGAGAAALGAAAIGAGALASSGDESKTAPAGDASATSDQPGDTSAATDTFVAAPTE